MAKFSLTIETEDGGELAALVAGMFGRHISTAHVSQGHAADDQGEQAEAGAGATSGESTTGKRTRRTKAQIEADNAAAAAGTPEPSSSTTGTAEQKSSSVPASGAGSTTPSPAPSPQGTQVSPAPQEPTQASPASEGEAPTLDMLKVTLGEVLKKRTAPEALALIKEHGNGATGLSQLAADRYPGVYAALKDLL